MSAAVRTSGSLPQRWHSGSPALKARRCSAASFAHFPLRPGGVVDRSQVDPRNGEMVSVRDGCGDGDEGVVGPAVARPGLPAVQSGVSGPEPFPGRCSDPSPLRRGGWAGSRAPGSPVPSPRTATSAPQPRVFPDDAVTTGRVIRGTAVTQPPGFVRGTRCVLWGPCSSFIPRGTRFLPSFHVCGVGSQNRHAVSQA